MRYVVPILLCTCASSFAQTAAPQTTQQVLVAQQATLQAIIDAADKVPATAALIAERTALQVQLDALNTQLGTLSAQIAAAEGPDVATARRAIQQLSRMLPRAARVAP